MTRIASLQHWAFAGALALLLGGCQTTPPEVYELAEKSGGNAGAFQGHLAAMAAQSTKLAQQRADNIVALEAGTARLDAYLRRELYMQQHANTPEAWSEINDLLGRLTALRDNLITIEQSATIASEDRRKELLAQQKALETYKAALKDTATALAALARRESAEERAKFLAGFARTVREDMKKAVADGDKAALAAKALIDSIKADASGEDKK